MASKSSNIPNIIGNIPVLSHQQHGVYNHPTVPIPAPKHSKPKGTLYSRYMQQSDLEQVAAISLIVHGDHYAESSELYQNRLQLCPEFTLTILFRPEGETTRKNDKIVGYAMGHLWTRESIPKLNQIYPEFPKMQDVEQEGCFWLHDTAFLPEYRGLNPQIIVDIVHHSFMVAYYHGVKRVHLAAIHGADALWKRYGFKELPKEQMPHAMRTIVESDFAEGSVILAGDLSDIMDYYRKNEKKAAKL